MGVFPVGSDVCQAPGVFYLDPNTKGIKNGQEILIFTLFIWLHSFYINRLFTSECDKG